MQQILQQRGLKKVEVIQSLWSGYGEIARYYQKGKEQTLVVKQVMLPDAVQHPRGWHSATGHLRKIDSYHNEARFYQQYSMCCPQQCRVPTCIECMDYHGMPMLIMEDLDAAGYGERRQSASLQDIYACIAWLASFHGRFLNTSTDALWPIGTYWHLATRQDEWNAMSHSELKQLAQSIDNRLNSAGFQTLLHGDAKLANFCFSAVLGDDALPQVAAVDFQYVGRGVGVKDLAYFLGSCLSQEALFEHEETLLSFYFQALAESVQHYCPQINFTVLESQWRDLYAMAWADFYRFLAGWSPEHPKINGYMRHQFALARMQLTGR